MIRRLATTLALLTSCLFGTGASAIVLDFEDAGFSGGLLPPPNDDLLIDQEIPGYGPAGVGLVWGPVSVLDIPGNIGSSNFANFPGWYNGVNCVPPNTAGACNGAYNFGGSIVTTVTATGAQRTRPRTPTFPSAGPA